MSDLLQAIDKLNHARQLFEAARMAVADIDPERERNALDAILTDALDCMRGGVEIVERVRIGAKP